MDDDSQKVFVLDVYNKYDDNSGVRRVFMINNHWYCVRACPMEWGKIMTPHIDDEYLNYHVFDTFEEASEAASKIKRAAEGKFE